MPGQTYLLTLAYLRDRKTEFITAKEISTALGTHYDTVIKALRQLTREKCVRRVNGPGHSYRFKFRSENPVDKKGNLTVLKGLPSATPVDPIELRRIVEHWNKNGWSPQSNLAAQTMLDMLAKLHQFYWLQLDRGISVEQSDLDLCKQYLSDARDKAEKFTLFFNRLLNTTQLWDATQSLTFVCGDLDSPLQYVESARYVDGAIKKSLQRVKGD